MAEIHINLKLNVKIPEEGIKINNLLYQLQSHHKKDKNERRSILTNGN